MLRISGLATGLIGPIDLTVRPGRVLLLTGPSGSGKSLFLRAIVDMDPNQGQVSLAGRDRAAMPAPAWRRLVAYVPAESGWWAEDVAAHFLPDPDPRPWLAALGLPDALDWEVARLSTGERQRLALVRALQRGPEALLLDEPTSALDQEATAAVERLIRDQAAAGRVVLLVSHDRGQGARIGDDFARMAEGRIAPVIQEARI
ncbi:MAG TPA: ATP-binding cassette domain-containing protein [Aliiroseovarius sp.]|nr:ATP-binding cassette domain-containing protein [Aliiroseovarius sp.]